jgi:FkbM family methyltransferase
VKGERTTDLAVPITSVTVDSNPVWVPDMLTRPALSEPEFAAFRYFQDPTETILDIGAHFGYSAASIWTAGARVMIVSFEPNPWHSACLEKIKTLRPGRFDYVTIGLGANNGQARFVMPVVDGVGISGLSSAAIESETDWAIPENLLAYMMGQRQGSAPPHLQFAEVSWPVARLDDILDQHLIGLPLDRIGALKIDAEGTEADVLAGSTMLLDRHCPMVMIEGANRVAPVTALLASHAYVYAEFDSGRVYLSEQRSERTSGFYLHRSKLDDYRHTSLLGN